MLDFSVFPGGDPTTQPMSAYLPVIRPLSGDPWSLRHNAGGGSEATGGDLDVYGLLVMVDGRRDDREDPRWQATFRMNHSEFKELARQRFRLLPRSDARFQVAIVIDEIREDPYVTVYRLLEFLHEIDSRR